jgi:hypothetical protein
MEYVLILMLGMFREDNAEFFDQKPSSDKKWVYVGKQAPIKGIETGEESIYFQLQDK